MSIRHICEHDGCFVKVLTPDWGFLDNSFSGKIRVGDIDGVVEANGHGLFLEWKSAGASIPLGQEIMFKNLSRSTNNRIIFFVINGDPKESVAVKTSIYANGVLQAVIGTDNGKLKRLCAAWEYFARNGGFNWDKKRSNTKQSSTSEKA